MPQATGRLAAAVPGYLLESSDLPAARRSPMPQPTVVICIDGFGPEYLDASDVPNLRDIGSRGFTKIGRSMMPSVTNVNNVSLVTASYPQVHGICSNYRLVRETGEEIYMESGEYLLAETMFQRARNQGKTSLLVTAKDKLRTLLGDGATVSVSAEKPPDWVVADIGDPPGIYTLEANGWVVKAARYLMDRHPADLGPSSLSPTGRTRSFDKPSFHQKFP